MPKLPFILVLTFFSTAAISQTMPGFVAHTFINEKADTLVYQLLIPFDETVKEKFPLVVFLHGAGERGSDNQKQLVHGASLFLEQQNREAFPAYVVFPQCPVDDYWASATVDRSVSPLQLDFDYERPVTKSLQQVLELVHTLKATKRIDVSRIYIVGLSMGGMGTFEAVYREPKLFAAAVPICGGGDTKKVSKKVFRIPFWVFHGTADNVVDVHHSQAMVERIKRFSKRVKYTEYEGVGHGSWDNVFREKDFLPWLFSQHR